MNGWMDGRTDPNIELRLNKAGYTATRNRWYSCVFVYCIGDTLARIAQLRLNILGLNLLGVNF